MSNEIKTVLPKAKKKYSSSVVGADYFPRMQKVASQQFFDQAKKRSKRTRVAKVLLAIVPVLNNDYSSLALAVVAPDEQGQVALERQIGWIAQTRCATLQPRVRSLMRASGGYVGAQASVEYWREESRWKPSEIRDGSFHLRIAQWQVVHDEVLVVMREAEPDIEQPWIEHRAPLTDVARRLYAEGVGRSEAELLPVRYELHDEELVATVDGEVLTSCTAGGRDFFDLLGARVKEEGPLRGWVRLHEGAVGVRLERRPDLRG